MSIGADLGNQFPDDPETDEIDLFEIRDILRRSTFFMQHRVTETELQYGAGLLFDSLRRQSVDALADSFTRTQKMQFREVPRYDLDFDDAGRPGKTFRATATCISQEDVRRLEEIVMQLTRIYGPRVRYRK